MTIYPQTRTVELTRDINGTFHLAETHYTIDPPTQTVSHYTERFTVHPHMAKWFTNVGTLARGHERSGTAKWDIEPTQSVLACVGLVRVATNEALLDELRAICSE